MERRDHDRAQRERREGLAAMRGLLVALVGSTVLWIGAILLVHLLLT